MGKFVIVLGAILIAASPGVTKPKEKEAPSWVTEIATGRFPSIRGEYPRSSYSKKEM